MMLNADTATARLRDAGLRLTPQRRAVIDALAGDVSHPLAEEVADKVAGRVPGISLSTVYKTLHEFASMGLIRELDLSGPMRFDSDTSAHAHLVCDGCGSVVDVPLSPELTAALRSAAGDLSVTGVDITLRGSCSTCTPQ